MAISSQIIQYLYQKLKPDIVGLMPRIGSGTSFSMMSMMSIGLVCECWRVNDTRITSWTNIFENYIPQACCIILFQLCMFSLKSFMYGWHTYLTENTSNEWNSHIQAEDEIIVLQQDPVCDKCS